MIFCWTMNIQDWCFPSESSNILQISLNQWTIFTQDCDILDPKSQGSKASDLDTMFVSTNFEEESGTHEAAANDDDALVRWGSYSHVRTCRTLLKYMCWASVAHSQTSQELTCICEDGGINGTQMVMSQTKQFS